MKPTTATAGPSNIVRVGEAQARESLHQSVRQACAAAGITTAQVANTCAGGSGAARPELAAIVHRILSELILSPIDVVGDIQIALEAAFDAGPGVIVIAGTGSIAYGRNQAGNTARAGGWGFAIGDEGSAHWIGRTAVSAVLRAADPRAQALASGATDTGVPHVSPHLRDVGPLPEQPRPQDLPRLSPLAQALAQTWGVTSLDDLARAANSIPPPDFASLFPAIAASRDELALQVLSSAGKELAQVTAVVTRHLFAAEQAATIPVAMIGGVFRQSQLVREEFYNELRRLDPRAEISPQVVHPVEGALRLARRAAARD